jgi:hypothetical protein
MFRLLRYIVIFLIGYKLLKQLFNASNANGNPQAPNNNPGASVPNNAGKNNSVTDKFNDAELIDYEEVK